MNNSDGFEKQNEKNNSYYDRDIENYQNSMFEYGILALKNSIILNGGALITIPAYTTILSNFSNKTLNVSAIFFVAGLISSMLAMYMAHLNFSFLVDHTQWEKYRRRQELELIYFEKVLSAEKSPEDVDRLISRINMKTSFTYWIAHFLGASGVICFAIGGYQLANAANKI